MGDAMEKDVFPCCSTCKHEDPPVYMDSSCEDCLQGSMWEAEEPPEGVVDKPPSPNLPEALAEAHWRYVKALLEMHDVPMLEVEHIGFHYKSAFIHGYKHAKEDYGDDDTTT